ncbi:MAG: sugar transferase, partial [Myxococcales bacterium]|nr:sugar transferase [Myxococcales bacterium]
MSADGRLARVLDVAAAISGLVALSPVIGATGLAVWMDLGRPVFFRQERGGRGGRTFRLVKFRTMREATDRDGAPLPDDARVTPLGRLLRRSRLDELPELVAILKGDMSLV